VFKISAAGALTPLYSFTGGADGGGPAGLVQGSDGNLYGTTFLGGANYAGTVFKFNPAGTLTTLYGFTGGADGGNPSAGLVQGSDSDFYGTTLLGGTYSFGTVFKISSAGALTNLYSFAGGADGASPYAGLVQGSDGNLYGTTLGGGTSSTNCPGTCGTVFKISSAGALTNLYSFTGGADGASPYAGLVQGSDGNLYGTTYTGGANDDGTVFKMLVSTLAFVDPNPSLIDKNGNLVSGLNQLATTGTVVTGVAADGVTLVLLRMRSDTPVTFSLASGSSADGSLLPLGGSGTGSTNITVSPQSAGGTNWVFAVYTSPLDFSSSPTNVNSRTIQFQVSGSSGTNNVSLQLVRPPVVLVHGVWSSYKAWVPFVSYLDTLGVQVCNGCNVDYGTAFPAPDFDPQYISFAVGALKNGVTVTCPHGLDSR
jgi:uncharacterized repeat protein (TIGR03803 family)